MNIILPKRPVNGRVVRAWQVIHGNNWRIQPIAYVYHKKTTWKKWVEGSHSNVNGADLVDDWMVHELQFETAAMNHYNCRGRVPGWANLAGFLGDKNTSTYPIYPTREAAVEAMRAMIIQRKEYHRVELARLDYALGELK